MPGPTAKAVEAAAAELVPWTVSQSKFDSRQVTCCKSAAPSCRLASACATAEPEGASEAGNPAP